MERHTTVPATLTPTVHATPKRRSEAGAHPIFLVLLGAVVLLLLATLFQRL